MYHKIERGIFKTQGTKMTTERLEPGVNYMLCPNPKCDLFTESAGIIPCEYDCPHQDKLRKIYLCPVCEGIIDLPGNHDLLMRVDHTCPNGKKPFILREGPHQVIYRIPKEQQ